MSRISLNRRSFGVWRTVAVALVCAIQGGVGSDRDPFGGEADPEVTVPPLFQARAKALAEFDELGNFLLKKPRFVTADLVVVLTVKGMWGRDQLIFALTGATGMECVARRFWIDHKIKAKDDKGLTSIPTSLTLELSSEINAVRAQEFHAEASGIANLKPIQQSATFLDANVFEVRFRKNGTWHEWSAFDADLTAHDEHKKHILGLFAKSQSITGSDLWNRSWSKLLKEDSGSW